MRRYKAIVLTAAVSFVLIAALVGYLAWKSAEQRTKLNQAVALGQEAIREGDFKEALNQFTLALGIEEDNETACGGKRRAEKELAKKERERERKRKAELFARTRRKALEFFGEAERQLAECDFEGALSSVMKAEGLECTREERERARDLKERIGEARKAHRKTLTARKVSGLLADASDLERAAEGFLEGGDSGKALERFVKARAKIKEALIEDPGNGAARKRLDALVFERMVPAYRNLEKFDLAAKIIEEDFPGENKSKEVVEEIERQRRMAGDYGVFLSELRTRIADERWDAALLLILGRPKDHLTPEVRTLLRNARWGKSQAQGAAAEASKDWFTALEKFRECLALCPENKKKETENRIAAARDAGYAHFLGEALESARANDLGEAAAELGKALAFREADRGRRLLAEIRAGMNSPEGMVFFLGGEFTVGNRDREFRNPERELHDFPSFFIGIHEVTNAKYQRFIKSGGYGTKDYWDDEGWGHVGGFVDRSGQSGPRGWEKGEFPMGREACPVTGVSWHEAVAFARWTRKRLPTAEEWELAAAWNHRKGKRRIYPWGTRWIHGGGNFFSERVLDVTRKGNRDVSPCGCSDMGGNVMEWVVLEDGGSGGLKGASCFSIGPRKMARAPMVVRWGERKKLLVRTEEIGFRLAADAK